jgi:hypothetical protein
MSLRFNWWDTLSRDNLSFSWGCHSGLQNFLIFDMIFIYWNWVYTRWKWLVDLHENRKDTARKEKQYTKQYKNNTRTKNTQNRKQKSTTKNTHKKNIMQHKSSD